MKVVKMHRIVIILLCLSTGIASAQTMDTIRWRQVFGDPQLVKLIETALEYNADLQMANLNVQQAKASLHAARLSMLPSLTVGAEGTISKTKDTPVSKTYNVPLTMQWEVDLAGQLRNEKRAAAASYWSTAETERGVQLQVITSVASCYYTLVMLDEQLNVTRQSIDNARQTVEAMETMKEVGMQNEAAVSQARVAYLGVLASEKSLLQQIQAAENALTVLIGQQQDSIGRASWSSTTISIDEEIPYSLACLANRPDVRAAEYALKAQTAQTGVARAAFYPSLNISASAGWTNNVGEVVNPGQMLLNAVGSLVQPLFNRGQNRANLRIAKARQEQALVAFNQSLLVAGTELSDALTACQLSRERLQVRQEEVMAARHAYEVSQIVMQHSSSTYLEVLTAQQSLLQSCLLLSSDYFDHIQGKINLFKALGGEIR